MNTLAQKFLQAAIKIDADTAAHAQRYASFKPRYGQEWDGHFGNFSDDEQAILYAEASRRTGNPVMVLRGRLVAVPSDHDMIPDGDGGFEMDDPEYRLWKFEPSSREYSAFWTHNAYSSDSSSQLFWAMYEELKAGNYAATRVDVEYKLARALLVKHNLNYIRTYMSREESNLFRTVKLPNGRTIEERVNTNRARYWIVDYSDPYNDSHRQVDINLAVIQRMLREGDVRSVILNHDSFNVDVEYRATVKAKKAVAEDKAASDKRKRAA